MLPIVVVVAFGFLGECFAHVLQRVAVAKTVCEERDTQMTEKEKACNFRCRPSFLVRLAGIEPTTPWFVAKYSIQLSYSRVSF